MLWRDHPDVPVVLLSAYNDEGIVKAAEEAHVAAYLVKGCTAGEILSTVGTVVKASQRKEAVGMIFSARRHSSTRSSAPFTHPEVTHPDAGPAVPTDGVTGGLDEEAAAGPRIHTVLVADDAAATREGLAEMMEDTSDLVCVAAVGDASAAVSEAAHYQPDVALLDVVMPGGGGLAAALGIRERLPGPACWPIRGLRPRLCRPDAAQRGAAGT